MISDHQFERVCEALSRRPRRDLSEHARALLALALDHATPGTGRIALSRAAMARKLRTHPANVSRALRTLEALDVVSTRRRGRAASHAVNPFAAWPGRGAVGPAAIEPPPDGGH